MAPAVSFVSAVCLLVVLVSTCQVKTVAGVVCNSNAVQRGLGRCQNNPSAFKCPDGSTCQCVAAIFNLCPPLRSPTGSWRRGIHVMSNCNSIPSYTAIATFPNGSYRGHAAVFISCSSQGIQVYDQWCGKVFGARLIRANGSGLSNNANGFYVIY